MSDEQVKVGFQHGDLILTEEEVEQATEVVVEATLALQETQMPSALTWAACITMMELVEKVRCGEVRLKPAAQAEFDRMYALAQELAARAVDNFQPADGQEDIIEGEVVEDVLQLPSMTNNGGRCLN